MANSQHQSIVEAVQALLTAAPALASGRVFEGRDMPLGSDVVSQIHVFANDSEPNADILTGAPVDWLSQIAIVIRARRDTTTGYSAEKVADALFVDVWSRVMAAQSLGGLAMQLQVGPVQRDRDQADPDVAAFTWLFHIVHRTTQTSIV